MKETGLPTNGGENVRSVGRTMFNERLRNSRVWESQDRKEAKVREGQDTTVKCRLTGRRKLH